MDSVPPLFDAVKSGDLHAVRRMLDEKPELLGIKNENGDSLFLYSVYTGQKAIAEYLRSRGTALSIFEASAAGLLETVKTLLENDPRSLNYTSHDGWTPLHLAAFFGHTDVTGFLLDLGANMHAFSANPTSVLPLHSALVNKQTDVALLLIDKGVDIEARQPNYAYTALHYAALNGLETVVRRLLELGARTSAEGADGKTPDVLAAEKGFSELSALIKAHANL